MVLAQLQQFARPTGRKAINPILVSKHWQWPWQRTTLVTWTDNFDSSRVQTSTFWVTWTLPIALGFIKVWRQSQLESLCRHQSLLVTSANIGGNAEDVNYIQNVLSGIRGLKTENRFGSTTYVSSGPAADMETSATEFMSLKMSFSKKKRLGRIG